MTTLTVRAYGRPAPQGSHEIGANGHVMHSSNYLGAWRRSVQIAAYKAYKAADIRHATLPLFRHGVPVFVHELVLLVTDEQCRAADTDEPTGRPDVDKLLRATVDGLGDARVFLDDSQIVKIYELSKARPAAGQQPGALIIISDRPRPVIEQGESMTTISTDEYRITLERVVARDAEGFPTSSTMFELFGTAGQISTAGLATVSALLGAGRVTVVDSSAAREQQAELAPEPVAPADTETKRGRGRPRKTAAAAAEPAAAAPEASPVPVAEPAADPVAQATAEPVVEQLPPAPAGRVNPFA